MRGEALEVLVDVLQSIDEVQQAYLLVLRLEMTVGEAVGALVRVQPIVVVLEIARLCQSMKITKSLSADRHIEKIDLQDGFSGEETGPHKMTGPFRKKGCLTNAKL